MCATCGCSSAAKATISVNLETGCVSAVALDERGHHHGHEHVHGDGTSQPRA